MVPSPRVYESTRLRDDGVTRLREDEVTKVREYESTKLVDHEFVAWRVGAKVQVGIMGT